MPKRQLFFTFILLFTAGFLVWLIIKDYPQKVETEKQLGDLKEQIEILKRYEKKQKGMVEYLNTESYLDKQARIRLNLKKQGEEVVFVYRKDEEGTEADEEAKNENLFLSKVEIWVRMLIYSVWSRDLAR